MISDDASGSGDDPGIQKIQLWGIEEVDVALFIVVDGHVEPEQRPINLRL